MRAALWLIVLVVAGCAIPAANNAPPPLRAADLQGTRGLEGAIDVKEDPYKSRIEYSTPVAQSGPLHDRELYVLAAHVNTKTGERRFFLQWAILYVDADWRFYSSANTEQGEPLRFTSLDRQVRSCSGTRYGRGCSYSESVDITFTPAMIQRGAKQGINLKISSRVSKDNIVDLSEVVISGLLTAVNAGKR